MSDKDKGISIYTILIAEKLEEDANGFPNYGSISVPGFFTSLDEAREAVTDNAGDMWETVYDYACIEKVDEGLYSADGFCEWYKFNVETGGYEKIDTPEFEEHICGRTIG